MAIACWLDMRERLLQPLKDLWSASQALLRSGGALPAAVAGLSALPVALLLCNKGGVQEEMRSLLLLARNRLPRPL